MSKQLTLNFEPGLTERFRNVRDAVAQGVYQRGLKRTAADMDMAPGNLSVALADDTQRKFCVDELETYVQTSGDLTPIYYLVERYLGDAHAAQDRAVAEALDALKNLPNLISRAGLDRKRK